MNHKKYIYVEWPESQEFMTADWFEQDAILNYNDGSCYFIPEDKYYQFIREKEIKEGERLICHLCGNDHIDLDGKRDYLTNKWEENENYRHWCRKCEEHVQLQKVEKFINHGYLVLSNFGGVAMQIDSSGEAARLKFHDELLPTIWLSIHTGPDGSSYVTYNNTGYFLNEFMKID